VNFSDLDALRSIERRRLDRFAESFDFVDASTYATLTETKPGPAVQRAQRDAVALLGSGARQRAVKAAISAFTDAASRAYSRRTSLPDTLLLFQSLPDRPEDRVRFLASVERAVVAIVLWDELAEDDRDALAGPWLSRIEAALRGDSLP
jgi:hypothetical protein